MLKQHKLVAGFTLIEILVALLIVSVGLLGVATLQVRGQQFNQVAYFRTQSAFLAHDLMERMRINTDRPNFNGTNGNADDGGYDQNQIYRDGNACPTQICDETNNCTVADLTTFDLAQWCNRLQEILPAAEAQIEWDNATTTYTITICWANILDGIDGNCDINNNKEGQSWIFQPQ